MLSFNLRKAESVMWIILGFFLAIGLVLPGIVLAWNPDQPQPFHDENGKPLTGSLAEKIRVEINGVKQGMFIQSKNIDNLVLLFVQGGPGMTLLVSGDPGLPCTASSATSATSV